MNNLLYSSIFDFFKADFYYAVVANDMYAFVSIILLLICGSFAYAAYKTKENPFMKALAFVGLFCFSCCFLFLQYAYVTVDKEEYKKEKWKKEIENLHLEYFNSPTDKKSTVDVDTTSNRSWREYIEEANTEEE